jgi:hypothetical protein
MSATYHIRIKKEYAASVIEDLQKMDAIDVLKETDDAEVSDWQQEEITRHIEKYKDRPELLIDEDRVFSMLDAD